MDKCNQMAQKVVRQHVVILYPCMFLVVNNLHVHHVTHAQYIKPEKYFQSPSTAGLVIEEVISGPAASEVSLSRYTPLYCGSDIREYLVK